jgi:hypothetical protein
MSTISVTGAARLIDLLAGQKVFAPSADQPKQNSTPDGHPINNPPVVRIEAVLEDEQPGYQGGSR